MRLASSRAEAHRRQLCDAASGGFGKGSNGVSTNGVTANFKFLDRGTFWVLPLAYFCIPKSARAYLFPQSDIIVTFAAAPLVLTQFVRNQRLPEASAPMAASSRAQSFCIVHPGSVV